MTQHIMQGQHMVSNRLSKQVCYGLLPLFLPQTVNTDRATVAASLYTEPYMLCMSELLALWLKNADAHNESPLPGAASQGVKFDPVPLGAPQPK
jgi:hypothetical protein